MFVAFDIGGTKTRVAVSKDGKAVEGEPVKFDTFADYEKGIQHMYDVASELMGGKKATIVVGGIGAPISEDKKRILDISKDNLKSWIGKPIGDDLGAKFGAPAYLENDSAVVGMGEAVAGAGVGHNIVAYLTVSTGVGGVRIVGGKLDQNALGFEPGHQIIDMDGTKCDKCISGTLENMVSGVATKRRFGVEPYEVPDRELWEEELPEWLAVGIHNTILHWSPDVVVLGGSMVVGDPAISVPQTAKYLNKISTVFEKNPEVKIAELGAFGGIHGALAFARQYDKEGV